MEFRRMAQRNLLSHRVIYHFFTDRDLEKMQVSQKPSSIYWCAQHWVGHCERSEVRMKLIPGLEELNLYPRKEDEGKVHACMLSRFSRVWLFASPWTVAHQALLSMGFPQARTLEWVAMPSPGDLPDPGIEHSLMFPALAGRFFTSSTIWGEGSILQTWKNLSLN